MPRVRRKAKRRPEYTRQERNMLTHGSSFTCPRFGTYRRANINWPILTAAWRDLEGELLPEWIAENPFTRPVGWLLFDAKKPRLRTVGEQRIESVEAAEKRGLGDLRLCFFEELNQRLGAEETRYDEQNWETEKQYLCRLNLLTESERALL
jgi:hypothetical protein